MNRSHHLKQTFLKNIEDNMGYDKLEFVLLDYNSEDDMEEWVKENLLQHIASGKVVYYKTFEPSAFKHSHAKNLVFKLANNDILCSINADHFAGENFARYVNESFANNDKIVLTPIPTLFYIEDDDHPPGDVWGLVCVQKKDFSTIRGFDERMINYGNEDIDFINRLEMLNVTREPVNKDFLSGYITHSDQERHSSIIKTDKLHAIYVRYESPACSEFIFLYKDKTFEKVILTNNLTNGSADYRFAYQPKQFLSFYSFENAERRGDWEENERSALFTYHEGPYFELLKEGAVLRCADTGIVYYHLTERETVQNVFNFYYLGLNTTIMQQNLNKKSSEVNPGGFGKAVVYKNFDYNNPIYV